MVQYRDRYYCLDIAGTNVSKWSFSSTTLTVASLFTGSVAMSCMVAFRDRIFAASENRIYYTELATSGGYPENWNSGNNFLSMPSLGSTIVSMIVNNNRIYIFTTEGVYQLYATGSPSNWEISLLSSTIKVFSKNAVALIKESFVYTDTEGVYIFNGATLKDIGQPIKQALKAGGYVAYNGTSYSTVAAASGHRILPYQDGFLLVLTNSTISGSYWIESRYPKYYYFDGVHWSEVDFGSVNSDIHYALMGVVSSPLRITASEAARPTDILVELRSTNLSPLTYKVYFSTVRKTNTSATAFFNATIATKAIKPSTTFWNLNRVKEMVTLTKNSFGGTLGSLSVQIVSDNTSATVASTHRDEMGSSTALYYTRHGVPVDRCTFFQPCISTSFPDGVVSQDNKSWPSFRLNEIGIKVNTDTLQKPAAS
jgi:hypothetical protein